MRYNETGGQVAYALDQSKTNLNTVAAILNTTLQDIRTAQDLVGMCNEKRAHLDAREKQVLYALKVVVKNPANGLSGDPPGGVSDSAQRPEGGAHRSPGRGGVSSGESPTWAEIMGRK